MNALEIARELIPDSEPKRFLFWPPDLFAFTSTILRRTEAYRSVVSPPSVDGKPKHWPQLLGEKSAPTIGEYASYVTGLADEWRGKLEEVKFHGTDKVPELHPQSLENLMDAVPSSLDEYWENFAGGIDPAEFISGIHEISQPQNWSHFCSLMLLHAVADEVMAPFASDSEFQKGSLFEYVRELFASSDGAHCSLAHIHPHRGRVLPKQHTPQTGLSLRSFSHYLAFHQSPLGLRWAFAERRSDPFAFSRLNCLVLPWPKVVRTVDFHDVSDGGIGHESLADGYGLFAYEPIKDLPENVVSRRIGEFTRYLEETLEAAEEEVRKIDLVVLPESALRFEGSGGDPAYDEVHHLEEILQRHDVDLYICGIREGDRGELGTARNGVLIGHRATGQFKKVGPQYKHHRWIMDRSQIGNYQLGSVLAPDKCWIENIEVQERAIHIVEASGITICPLICEDLARQEPVAELVRAIGPTLVVSVLVDGPQFDGRWAAKYSSVLADDPGSSILTVTSQGMVNRWSSPWKQARPIVALWTDSKAPPRELRLEDHQNGLLLSLCVEASKEITADGRLKQYYEEYREDFKQTKGGAQTAYLFGEQQI